MQISPKGILKFWLLMLFTFTFFNLIEESLFLSIKDFYIEKKLAGMTEKELREFVLEIITHQIHDTIGKEEEIEAWKEMSDFFGDKFNEIILEIQKKHQDYDENINIQEDSQKNRIEFILRSRRRDSE